MFYHRKVLFWKLGCVAVFPGCIVENSSNAATNDFFFERTVVIVIVVKAQCKLTEMGSRQESAEQNFCCRRNERRKKERRNWGRRRSRTLSGGFDWLPAGAAVGVREEGSKAISGGLGLGWCPGGNWSDAFLLLMGDSDSKWASAGLQEAVFWADPESVLSADREFVCQKIFQPLLWSQYPHLLSKWCTSHERERWEKIEITDPWWWLKPHWPWRKDVQSWRSTA